MTPESPNPTPIEVRTLLRKHVEGEKLEPHEREQLVAYLKRLRNDQSAAKPERAAAWQLLAAMNHK